MMCVMPLNFQLIATIVTDMPYSVGSIQLPHGRNSARLASLLAYLLSSSLGFSLSCGTGMIISAWNGLSWVGESLTEQPASLIAWADSIYQPQSFFPLSDAAFCIPISAISASEATPIRLTGISRESSVRSEYRHTSMADRSVP